MARAQHGDTRRGEILDQAFVAFAAHGYHALSVRDLARELGATTGTLYHWFDGKPALFEAMLERQVARQVAAALDEIRPLPSAERLGALADFVARNADDLQHTLVVSLDYHRAQGGGPGLSTALAAYESALAEGMGLEPGVARLVLSTLLGELLQRVLDPARTIERGLLLRLAHADPSAPSSRPG